MIQICANHCNSGNDEYRRQLLSFYNQLKSQPYEDLTHSFKYNMEDFRSTWVCQSGQLKKPFRALKTTPAFYICPFVIICMHFIKGHISLTAKVNKSLHWEGFFFCKTKKGPYLFSKEANYLLLTFINFLDSSEMLIS